MKRGKLVIHGDVGQTFMYGAKGGEVYVLGNAAGPAADQRRRDGPRVVINGTCLDFLAESFMAGDPLNGGGFVILNGIEFDERRPHRRRRPRRTRAATCSRWPRAAPSTSATRTSKVVEEQLNGGEFCPLTDKDWRLIRPTWRRTSGCSASGSTTC